MLSRAEEIDLGRAAKAHCIQSCRWSRTSNHLPGQRDRRAANRRISHFQQSLMLISTSVRRAILALAVEETHRQSRLSQLSVQWVGRSRKIETNDSPNRVISRSLIVLPRRAEAMSFSNRSNSSTKAASSSVIGSMSQHVFSNPG